MTHEERQEALHAAIRQTYDDDVARLRAELDAALKAMRDAVAEADQRVRFEIDAVARLTNERNAAMEMNAEAERHCVTLARERNEARGMIESLLVKRDAEKARADAVTEALHRVRLRCDDALDRDGQDEIDETQIEEDVRLIVEERDALAVPGPGAALAERLRKLEAVTEAFEAWVGVPAPPEENALRGWADQFRRARAALEEKP